MKHKKQAVAISSMMASALMTVGKLIVGLSTGSLGILSEALHSLLDFAATVMTYMAVRISDNPADTEHPYGHGKIESVAALAETGLLFVTSFGIIYEAGHRLYSGKFEVEATWWSAGVILASILVDISRARALKRVAKETNSQALEADALHFSSDVLSSIVVLVGLGFVALGLPVGDPLAAIGVSIFVCRAGWMLGRRTIDTLIDTAPQGAAERIKRMIDTVNNVVGVSRVRIRPAGSISFVEVEVAVGRGLSLTRITNVRDDIVERIHKEMPEAEVSVTTVPLALDNETVFQRVMIIASYHNVAVHHVTICNSKGHLSLAFDLEVDGHCTLREAHDTASYLETAMRAEFGDDTEVETHIEPLEDKGLEGADVDEDELKKITELLVGLAKAGDSLSQIHKVRVKKTNLGLIVIFHCLAGSQRTVAEIHEIVDDMERNVRKAYPGIWRIVSHAEPQEQEIRARLQISESTQCRHPRESGDPSWPQESK